MNTAKLIKWGNSVGIRIPAQNLKQANAYVGEEFTIIANADGGFTLTPVKTSQKEWLEAFNAIADQQQDELFIADQETEFDKDEWEW